MTDHVQDISRRGIMGGAALVVLIGIFGPVSGAQFNPAVTLGVWLRGKCDTKDVFPYMASQVAGAVIAAMTVKFLQGHGGTVSEVPADRALVAEFLGTFALVWVVLNVATTKATAGNSFYGAAIGLTVTAMVL